MTDNRAGYPIHPARPASFYERFWSRVDKGDNCWVWTAGTTHGGYGTITYQWKDLRVHRLSYEIHYGEIPAGLFVCHHCDNPPCVNPAHLFVGTLLDNVRDMMSKGRQTRGEAHASSRFTEGDVRVMRLAYEKGESRASIGRRFDAPWQTIDKIVSRKTWKHI